MREKMKKWAMPIAFTVGGAIVGLVYYFLAGCSTGSCAITSNPFTVMLYMGAAGWLLSVVFSGECKGG